MPLPKAWNVPLETIENGAIKNAKLIILSAGIPIESMLSEASNNLRIGTGKVWQRTNPANIIPNA